MPSWPKRAANRVKNEAVWIIDPLDGTTNFVHGFPVFAVSIAVQIRGQLEAAVIYDPLRQEIFTAARAGCQLDNRRVRVSKQRGLEGSLLATGFPYREDDEFTEPYFAMFRALSKVAAGIRRPGAAALDLAYVAAGRVDGFWEMGLKPWDTAAGTLMILEAGGRVGALDGGPYQLGPNIVAGNPKVYEGLSPPSDRICRRRCARRSARVVMPACGRRPAPPHQWQAMDWRHCGKTVRVGSLKPTSGA